MTTSDLTISPIIKGCYQNGFKADLVGYLVEGDKSAAKALLEQLRSQSQAGDTTRLQQLALFLLANTKARQQHPTEERLRVAGMVQVMKDFPLSAVEYTVSNWHKRADDSAIFTPSQAELYRALSEQSEAFSKLLDTLEKVAFDV